MKGVKVKERALMGGRKCVCVCVEDRVKRVETKEMKK